MALHAGDGPHTAPNRPEESSRSPHGAVGSGLPRQGRVHSGSRKGRLRPLDVARTVRNPRLFPLMTAEVARIRAGAPSSVRTHRQLLDSFPRPVFIDELTRIDMHVGNFQSVGTGPPPFTNRNTRRALESKSLAVQPSVDAGHRRPCHAGDPLLQAVHQVRDRGPRHGLRQARRLSRSCGSTPPRGPSSPSK